MDMLINLLIIVAVLVIVALVLWFLFSKLTLPEPIRSIVLIVAVVVVAIIGIYFLLSLRGGHFSLGLLDWTGPLVNFLA